MCFDTTKTHRDTSASFNTAPRRGLGYSPKLAAPSLERVPSVRLVRNDARHLCNIGPFASLGRDEIREVLWRAGPGIGL